MEKMVNDRRRFLYLVAAVSISSAAPELTASNAIDIINERKNRLENVVRSNPSPFVGQVFNDHEGYLIREMINKLADTVLNDNSIYRDVVNDLIKFYHIQWLV